MNKSKVVLEVLRRIMQKRLVENAPAPSKPKEKPGTTTKPGKPGEKEKPRRPLGNPNVKPAPKAMNEEEVLKKIVSRFKSKKK
jgi:hypothetical protein